MNCLRLFLLWAFGLAMTTSLGAEVHSYTIFDHQIVNFLTQKCRFDLEDTWQDVFRRSITQRIKGSNKFQDKTVLTQQDKERLFSLQQKMLRAVQGMCNALDYQKNIEFSYEVVERLIAPRINPTYVQDEALQGRIEDELKKVDDVINQRFDRNEGGKKITISLEALTAPMLLSAIMSLVIDHFDPVSIEARLKHATAEQRNFIKQLPCVCICLDHDDEENSLTLAAFPSDTLFRLEGDQQKMLDCPDVLYENFKANPVWKKVFGWGAVALIAAYGCHSAHENWDAISMKARDVRDSLWNPNQCGDDLVAGPGCISPWEIRCQGDNCGPEKLGAEDASWFVVGNCADQSDTCPATGYQSIALVGGKNHCSLDKPLPSSLAFVGQITPGAWHCPAGKSPFNFLSDGRLCFYQAPVIRAGVDKPVCGAAAPYCKLPGELTLFRNGDDLLLTPPCGQGVKICTIGDLKLYLHEDGKYRESSPCDPVQTGGICVFEQSSIEFWNEQTQQWQSKPVDYSQDQMMYRFKTGQDQEVKVFCNKDGSCTLTFPCALSAGVCPIDKTIFYTKQGSGVWTEGMPCVLGDDYCMLENGAVFYPHVTGNEVEWRDVPAWTGNPTGGLFVGPDGQKFIPNQHCDAWMRLIDGECFVSNDGVYCVGQDGANRYWHRNAQGECGWHSAPVCTGKECDGICVGPDGRVFVLNDSLTAWVPESEGCKHETALFCIDKDAQGQEVVKYWHRCVDGEKTGAWHTVPDCNDFAGQGHCVGLDGSLFKLDDATQQFVRLQVPHDPSKSALVEFKDGNYAAWDPSQGKWLLNNAPVACVHDNEYCTLDDGNELYAHTLVAGADNAAPVKVWKLEPYVRRSPRLNPNVITFKDGTKRWRQVGKPTWTKVMPCPESDQEYVVSREVFQNALDSQQEGRAKVLIDEDTCVDVAVDQLKPYCDSCSILPVNGCDSSTDFSKKE